MNVWKSVVGAIIAAVGVISAGFLTVCHCKYGGVSHRSKCMQLSKKFDKEIDKNTIVGFAYVPELKDGENVPGSVVVYPIVPTNDLKDASLQIFRLWETTNPCGERACDCRWIPVYADSHVSDTCIKIKLERGYTKFDTTNVSKDNIIYDGEAYYRKDKIGEFLEKAPLTILKDNWDPKTRNDNRLFFKQWGQILSKDKEPRRGEIDDDITNIDVLNLYDNIKNKDDVNMGYYDYNDEKNPAYKKKK